MTPELIDAYAEAICKVALVIVILYVIAKYLTAEEE